MPLVISLSGFKGSGKDTAALIMQSKMPFEGLSFAAPLKEALAAMFGWPRELLDGTTPESRAPLVLRRPPHSYRAAAASLSLSLCRRSLHCRAAGSAFVVAPPLPSLRQ